MAAGALGATLHAAAAIAEPSYRDCITAETETGPSGSGACAGLGRSAPAAVDTGLDRLRSDAVSPDGRSLYTASVFDDAVARFERDPATGQLAYRECITGRDPEWPERFERCAQTPTASSGGADSGMDETVPLR